MSASLLFARPPLLADALHLLMKHFEHQSFQPGEFPYSFDCVTTDGRRATLEMKLLVDDGEPWLTKS